MHHEKRYRKGGRREGSEGDEEIGSKKRKVQFKCRNLIKSIGFDRIVNICPLIIRPHLT
jgi:hypothetical protein